MRCVQVRDMTGDGSVVKRRIRDGQGEFPVDCPIEDSSVRVHYRCTTLFAAESIILRPSQVQAAHIYLLSCETTISSWLQPVSFTAAGSSSQSRGGCCWTRAGRIEPRRRWSFRQACKQLCIHMHNWSVEFLCLHVSISALQFCQLAATRGVLPCELNSGVRKEGSECGVDEIHCLHMHDVTVKEARTAQRLLPEAELLLTTS